MSSNPALNYEEIVQEFARKDRAAYSLNQRKSALAEQLRASFERYEQALERYVTANMKHTDCLVKINNCRKFLENAKDTRNMQIGKILQETDEIYQGISIESLMLSKNLKLIQNRADDLTSEFNGETLRNEIRKIDEIIQDPKQQIEYAEQKLKKAATLRINEEYSVIPGLSEISRTLSQESLKAFGDSRKAKQRFAELGQNISFMKNRVDEILQAETEAEKRSQQSTY